jgi:replication-associated recombination protein RarA
MGFRAYTQHSYPLLEVISAIQKEIRRGNERSAMYWSLELIPRYEQYLWRRLLVIVNEDIGIASPELLSTIPALRAQYFFFRSHGKDGTCRLILGNALLLMSRAPKSRIADHFQRAVTQEFMDERHDIPDHALDNHTGRGRAMGRDVQYWLDEGCRLQPQGNVPDPYAEEAQELWLQGKDDAPEWERRRQEQPTGNAETQLQMF